MPRTLYLLALCNLVLGTGAFVLGGILEPLAAALQVSIGTAGQAMTTYAIATALLAPALLVATGRWRRRTALVLGMAVFAAGNAVCAMADSIGTLYAGRALMGLGSMFTPAAAGLALALVEPARRGRALSLVFLGISLSYVIGIPLGAWLGLRHGWHAPVWACAAAAAGCALLLRLALPRDIPAPGASLAGAGGLLTHAPVLRTLALTLLYFTAIFTVFSYSAPVLRALHPMSNERLSVTLMLFGLSGVVGTLVGGWANDRFGPLRTLTVQLAVLAAAMVAIPFARGHYAGIVALFLLWGVAGFGMMTPQQSRLAALVPPQAPLLLSLNTSMLYLGTAAGAAVGGAFAGTLGFERLSWVGAPFAVAGWLLLQLSRAKAAARLAAASGSDR